MYKSIYLIFLFTHHCYGVIYNLNETEYERMPPVYQIDDYDDCFLTPNNVYCSINFDLVLDQPSDLLYIIQEYSEHLTTHYNHTNLRYGVCVTKSCKHIRNESEVSENSLEVCLNETMWKNYQLKANVQNYVCYNDSDNNVQIDTADVIVFVVLISLFALNIIGTIYDEYFHKSEDKALLLCFSLKRNWKRLTFSTQSKESSMQKFKGIDGIRCIILYGMIFVHTIWAYLVAVKNAHTLEQMYNFLPLHILLNGPIAIQTCIVISGLLLSYNLELYSEKHQINWLIIPKGIFIRYLRLTPGYAIVIALMATWLKFIGPSALWEVTAKPAMVDCQNRWWLNLLYLNNYVYNTQCAIQGWYLATDMQLFCFGLVLCTLISKSRFQKVILASLIIVGMAIPGIITYLKDLDGTLLLAPGEVRYLYETEPTFNEVYKVGHTNVPSFLIGIALGYIVYGLQQKKIDVTQFKNYRIIHWASLPVLIAIIMSGSIFYRDAPREPLYIRVLYATFSKPLFSFVMAILICGLIFRIENTYSTFFESNIWSIPSKLSYSVYLIHFSYIRIHVAMQSHLMYIAHYHTILLTTCVTAISLLTAVPLWLFVEAPFTELTKYIISNSAQKKNPVINNECQEKINSHTHL